MKPCPYCGEEIQDSAIKCRFCGEWLEKPPSQAQPRSRAKKSEGVKLYSEQRKEWEHQKKAEERFRPEVGVNWKVVMIFIAVAIAMLWIFSDWGSEKTEQVEMKDAQVEQRQVEEELSPRERLIKEQFSAWDGSHHNLKKEIKASMHDPGSFKHMETVYWDRGDHLVVRTTFRGKNMFGGYVKSSVKAKVSLDGDVLEIIE